jgi:hypothetical protein
VREGMSEREQVQNDVEWGGHGGDACCGHISTHDAVWNGTPMSCHAMYRIDTYTTHQTAWGYINSVLLAQLPTWYNIK